ncbi:hypothetical protein NK8_58250 (plasmid) [Caballeronia sp. NK8]|nr:hypothetical protein NK8_58250 [Caballeronia sp. NK8]
MKLPELNVRETESDDEDDLSDEEMKRAKSDVSKPETDNEEDQHDEAEADEAEEDEAEADADNRQREQERANSSDDALNQKRQDSEEDSRPASTPKTGNGTVFMTHAFYGAELSRSDLRGAAVYIPARPGSEFFIGPARPAMLLGINAAELMMGLASPTTLHIAERAIARARALLLLDGVHVVPRDGLEFLVGHLN